MCPPFGEAVHTTGEPPHDRPDGEMGVVNRMKIGSFPVRGLNAGADFPVELLTPPPKERFTGGTMHSLKPHNVRLREFCTMRFSISPRDSAASGKSVRGSGESGKGQRAWLSRLAGWPTYSIIIQSQESMRRRENPSEASVVLHRSSRRSLIANQTNCLKWPVRSYPVSPLLEPVLFPTLAANLLCPLAAPNSLGFRLLSVTILRRPLRPTLDSHRATVTHASPPEPRPLSRTNRIFRPSN